MSVSLVLDTEEIALFREAFPNMVQRAIYNAVRRIERMAKEQTPIRKRAWEPGGKLQQTLRVWSSFGDIRIEWPAPYAEYVDKGVGPHKITARAGKPMRWQDPFGVWRSAYSVDHPGQRGQGFVMRIGQMALEILREELFNILVTVALHGG